MTLKEWINENPTEFINLGARSGFFYIGIASDFKQYAEELDRQNIEGKKTRLLVHYNQLNSESTLLPKLDERIKELKHEMRIPIRNKLEIKKELKELTEQVADYMRKREKKPDMIVNAEKYIENYVPLMDRNIKEIFVRKADEKGQINVLIEGSEFGQYYGIWDRYKGPKFYTENVYGK